MKTNKYQNVSIAYLITTLVVFLLLVIGWVMNIYKLFTNDSTEITGMIIVQVVGIFLAPIGGVVGWFA